MPRVNRYHGGLTESFPRRPVVPPEPQDNPRLDESNKRGQREDNQNRDGEAILEVEFKHLRSPVSSRGLSTRRIQRLVEAIAPRVSARQRCSHTSTRTYNPRRLNPGLTAVPRKLAPIGPAPAPSEPERVTPLARSPDAKPIAGALYPSGGGHCRIAAGPYTHGPSRIAQGPDISIPNPSPTKWYPNNAALDQFLEDLFKQTRRAVQTARIKSVHWIAKRVPVEIRIPPVEQNRIFRGPLARVSIIIPRPKPHEPGVVIVQATRKPKRLKARCGVLQHPSKRIVVHALHHLSRLRIHHQPHAPQMVRDETIHGAVGHDHGIGHVGTGAVEKGCPHIPGAVELGDGVQGIGVEPAFFEVSRLFCEDSRAIRQSTASSLPLRSRYKP